MKASSLMVRMTPPRREIGGFNRIDMFAKAFYRKSRNGEKHLYMVQQTGKRVQVVYLRTKGDETISVLDNHAHALIGEFDTYPLAIKSIRDDWRIRSKAPAPEPCACPDVSLRLAPSSPAATKP